MRQLKCLPASAPGLPLQKRQGVWYRSRKINLISCLYSPFLYCLHLSLHHLCLFIYFKMVTYECWHSYLWSYLACQWPLFVFENMKRDKKGDMVLEVEDGKKWKEKKSITRSGLMRWMVCVRWRHRTGDGKNGKKQERLVEVSRVELLKKQAK